MTDSDRFVLFANEKVISITDEDIGTILYYQEYNPLNKHLIQECLNVTNMLNNLQKQINKQETNDTMSNDKEKILKICNRLKKYGFIREVICNKYTVDICVNAEDDYEEDAIMVLDRVKSNFEKKGYHTHIYSTYWLEITFEDYEKIIDDCFKLDTEC